MGVLRRWGRPAGVVAAVLALIGAFGVLIGHGWAYPGRVTVDPRHPASLPGRVPGYSTLTGDLLRAPIGRAVALYNQNTGAEDAPEPQVVLAGADRDDYRRLLVDGSPSVLLRPDGRVVAVGGFEQESPAPPVIQLVDLDTGARHPVRTSGYSQLLLAWSPDGRYLAYLTGPSQPADDGPLAIVDLVTGRNVRTTWPKSWPGAPNVAAAFAPDGRHLAVQSNGELRVLGLDGVPVRKLAVPDGYELRSPAAWSPDGRFIAVQLKRPDFTDRSVRPVAFVDATGGAGPVPAPLTAGGPGYGPVGVLGWRSPTDLLVTVDEYRSLSENLIESVSTVDGQDQVLSRFEMDPGDEFAVERVQLATGLLAGIRVRPAGDADRGPWPDWTVWSVAAVLGVPAVTVLVFTGVNWRRRRWAS